MTTWRDQLLDGSFRGVPFLIMGHEGEVGRRSVVHEMPDADVPVAEDLGRRARRSRVECIVIGDDYMTARDNLRVAFETPGPGELVHPYWGTFQAVTDGAIRVRESTKEGGMATFDVAFVEVDAELDLGASVDTAGAVTDAGGLDDASQGVDTTPDGLPTAAGAACGSFVTSFNFGLLSALHAQTALDELGRALALLQGVRAAIGAPFGLVDAFVASVAAIQSQLTALAATPAVLAAQLAGLVSQLSGSLQAIGLAEATGTVVGDSFVVGTAAASAAVVTTGIATSALVSSSGVSGLPGASAVVPVSPGGVLSGPSGGPLPVDPRLPAAVAQLATQLVAYTAAPTRAQAAGLPVLTPAQQQEAANSRAIAQLVQVTGLVAACEASTAIAYQSSDSALQLRTTFADLFDALDIEDPTLFSAMEVLRTAVANHLSVTAGALPRSVQYSPSKTLPALVVAHLVYGDARRETEICQFNNIADPVFVAGGVALEVLDG